MFIAFIFAMGMNFFSYWFSDKIVLRNVPGPGGDAPAGTRAAPDGAGPGHEGGPAHAARLHHPRGHAECLCNGRNEKHAVVAVTEGIMRILSREELEGVISHELSHIKNRDILIGSIAATIAGAITMLANMAQWAAIFGGGPRRGRGGRRRVRRNDLHGDPCPHRGHADPDGHLPFEEYMADDGGAKVSGKPWALAGALEKLQAASQAIPMNANPSTAHMFIVTPSRDGRS